MAQSKVKEVKGNGSWESKYGHTMYNFEYELEDGVIGLANHKTKEPKFNPGDPVEYNIKGKDIKGNTTLEFVQQNPFSAGSGKSNSSFALSYAKDLVVSGHAKIEDTLKYADKFNKWLNQN